MEQFGHGPPDAYGCPLPPLGIDASSARQVRARHAWDFCARGAAEPQLTRATRRRSAARRWRPSAPASRCGRRVPAAEGPKQRACSAAISRRAADAYHDARSLRAASAMTRLRRCRQRATT